MLALILTLSWAFVLRGESFLSTEPQVSEMGLFSWPLGNPSGGWRGGWLTGPGRVRNQKRSLRGRRGGVRSQLTPKWGCGWCYYLSFLPRRKQAEILGNLSKALQLLSNRI